MRFQLGLRLLSSACAVRPSIVRSYESDSVDRIVSMVIVETEPSAVARMNAAHRSETVRRRVADGP